MTVASTGDRGIDREAPDRGLMERLAGEWSALGARRPALVRRLRWLGDHPAAVLLPWAGLMAGLLGADNPGGDAQWFRQAGLSMFGPDVFDVFSTPGLQMGPLYLLFVGMLAAAVQVVGLPVLFTVAAVQSMGIAWFALFTARRWAAELGADPRRAQWGVVAPMVFGGLLEESIGNGHPEEVLLGLLLANAALWAQQGKLTRPGALIGLATGIKLWGLLGAPILLIGRRPRVVVIGALSIILIAVACYAPFFLLGDVNTFDFAWGTTRTPVSFVTTAWGWSDWALRLVQGAVVALAGCLVAWRRSGTALVVVLAIIATRLVLDPLFLTYYPGPFIVVALLWVWTSPVSIRMPWPVVASAAVPLTVVLPYVLAMVPMTIAAHAAFIAVTVAVLLRERASAHTSEAVEGPPGRDPDELSRTR